MEPKTPGAAAEDDDADALESPEPTGTGVIDATGNSSSAAAAQPAENYKPPKKSLKQKLARYNIYLLIFIFIIIIAIGVTVLTYFASKKADTKSTVSSQTLDKKALAQLANTDATIGDPKQVLNVQSNAVFAGKVLVRDTLEVAGGIQVTGAVSLSGLTVTGKANLDETQVSKNLAVAGDLGVQGNLTLLKNLQVSGSGAFNGPLTAPQITVTGLQLNGDLVLTHHISIGGPSPGKTAGTALGSGGSASISGSDTSGTATINIGTGAPAGCFISVNFAQKYNTVPRVIASPIGSDAGKLDYYITRTTSSFSICDATAPPASISFSFDYFVVD